ncbi:MAG TPA: amidase [Alphaproteobacteria bacterium]|nr:amidase [Alphaproteobacteria bacterium]
MSADPFGALSCELRPPLKGLGRGPLAGLTFVAKDVFDIAGHPTGAGSPEWLCTHPPAFETAPVIDRLLRAGASLVGKSHTDELAYSLNGQNQHYGTPLNPRAPDRIPGGSSSGSAVAVAGELVDFSIGTDCGGSVRLPASYCGILGFRPSHGRIPLDHAVPLAPSFDVVGWFARDPGVLETVGEVLLEAVRVHALPARLHVASDLFALVPGAVGEALRPGLEALGKLIGSVEEGPLLAGDGINRVEVFRTIQGGEAWIAHGAWIRATRPAFGPGVRERFEKAATVTSTQLIEARRQRELFASRLNAALEADMVACLPTAPGPAPLKTASGEHLEDFRNQALGLLSVAGLARLPQISLPLGVLEGCPLGLSVIARHGADMSLLALARRLLS